MRGCFEQFGSKKGDWFQSFPSSPLELLKSSAADRYTKQCLLPLQICSLGLKLHPLILNLSSAPRSHRISPIQSLVGQTGRRWVMGVISQLDDGHFYLEDLTASVEINLSNAKITT